MPSKKDLSQAPANNNNTASKERTTLLSMYVKHMANQTLKDHLAQAFYRTVKDLARYERATSIIETLLALKLNDKPNSAIQSNASNTTYKRQQNRALKSNKQLKSEMKQAAMAVAKYIKQHDKPATVPYSQISGSTVTLPEALYNGIKHIVKPRPIDLDSCDSYQAPLIDAVTKINNEQAYEPCTMLNSRTQEYEPICQSGENATTLQQRLATLKSLSAQFNLPPIALFAYFHYLNHPDYKQGHHRTPIYDPTQSKEEAKDQHFTAFAHTYKLVGFTHITPHHDLQVPYTNKSAPILDFYVGFMDWWLHKNNPALPQTQAIDIKTLKVNISRIPKIAKDFPVSPEVWRNIFHYSLAVANSLQYKNPQDKSKNMTLIIEKIFHAIKEVIKQPKDSNKSIDPNIWVGLLQECVADAIKLQPSQTALFQHFQRWLKSTDKTLKEFVFIYNTAMDIKKATRSRVFGRIGLAADKPGGLLGKLLCLASRIFFGNDPNQKNNQILEAGIGGRSSAAASTTKTTKNNPNKTEKEATVTSYQASSPTPPKRAEAKQLPQKNLTQGQFDTQKLELNLPQAPTDTSDKNADIQNCARITAPKSNNNKNKAENQKHEEKQQAEVTMHS